MQRMKSRFLRNICRRAHRECIQTNMRRESSGTIKLTGTKDIVGDICVHFVRYDGDDVALNLFSSLTNYWRLVFRGS